MARIVPSSAYLLLEHQPAINRTYTERLEVIKKNSLPNGVINVTCVWGLRIHMESASASPSVGAIVKPRRFTFLGVTRCLRKSLSASARGWGSPISPTFLGPFRSCAWARNFRSNSV